MELKRSLIYLEISAEKSSEICLKFNLSSNESVSLCKFVHFQSVCFLERNISVEIHVTEFNQILNSVFQTTSSE